MRRPITVKELGNYLRHQLLSDPYIQNIYITGEIVNLGIRKYTYFSLKEDNEIISCIYFDNDFDFEEGDKVVINASLNLYQRDSRYQLKVKKIELIGEGKNFILLKELKEKLLKKGYFSELFKKEIPIYPQNIGLITGENSAAYYDFIKVLSDNNYDSTIYLYNTLVQGSNAETQISNALKKLDSLNLDLIVMTRGGGSKEELSIFNSELIADTIFDLETPIISAIGHEIDLSIAELVSDQYVSTPTRAAETIVYHYKNILDKIKSTKQSMDRNIQSRMNNLIAELNEYKLMIHANRPEHLLDKLIHGVESLNKEIDSKLRELVYSNEKTINYLSKAIATQYNSILEKNNLFVKDINLQFVDPRKLVVGNEYILTNNDISYKIIIKEKL